jgi:hypothetical protein
VCLVEAQPSWIAARNGVERVERRLQAPDVLLVDSTADIDVLCEDGRAGGSSWRS